MLRSCQDLPEHDKNETVISGLTFRVRRHLYIDVPGPFVRGRVVNKRGGKLRLRSRSGDTITSDLDHPLMQETIGSALAYQSKACKIKFFSSSFDKNNDDIQEENLKCLDRLVCFGALMLTFFEHFRQYTTMLLIDPDARTGRFHVRGFGG